MKAKVVLAMNVFLATVLTCAAGLIIQACPPPAPPVYPPDVADGGSQDEDLPEATIQEAASPDPGPPVNPACSYACYQYNLLGCTLEGSSPACPGLLTKINAGRLRPTPGGKPLTCDMVGQAKTVAQLKALGLPCHQKDSGT